MPTALVITSSALGEASVSSQLVAETVARMQSHVAGMRIVARDLGRYPIPHLDANSATALRGGDPANYHQLAAHTCSNELIAELKDADTLIIGAPMYNFGIPSTLKAWLDHVLRAGVTFRYSDSGPEGLIKDKRAIVMQSRGGMYSEGPAQAMDSQEPHLRSLLGFMGITDVTFLRAEKLAFRPDAPEQAVEAVRGQIARLIGETWPKAA